jgi:hypothetical protein
MQRTLKFSLLALTPVTITLGGWKLTSTIGAALDCPVPSKEQLTCSVGGENLAELLDFVAWWGMLLWIPYAIVSTLCLLVVAQTWAMQRRKVP